jgi:hypothetical protein
MHHVGDVWVRSQASPLEISGVQSGTGSDSSPSTSVSPVSNIPPMSHTHMSVSHAI